MVLASGGTISTFTTLHQMTNYVPIPGIVPKISQMASHPTSLTPIVKHNPLANPLRDISGRDRTIADYVNSNIKYHKMKQIEE